MTNFKDPEPPPTDMLAEFAEMAASDEPPVLVTILVEGGGKFFRNEGIRSPDFIRDFAVLLAKHAGPLG